MEYSVLCAKGKDGTRTFRYEYERQKTRSHKETIGVHGGSQADRNAKDTPVIAPLAQMDRAGDF